MSKLIEISNLKFSIDSLAKPVIVIIGPPGSGKTEVGELLAEALSWTFWDTDKLIEQATKLTIAQIFSDHGEQTLRLLEKKLVAKFEQLNRSQPTQSGGTVISTGGGLPIDKENYRILSNIGRIISLSADLDVLAQRALQQGNRPLLESKNSSSQKARLESLVKERSPVYQQAQWSIDTTKLTAAQVVDLIKQELPAKLNT